MKSVKPGLYRSTNLNRCESYVAREKSRHVVSASRDKVSLLLTFLPIGGTYQSHRQFTLAQLQMPKLGLYSMGTQVLTLCGLDLSPTGWFRFRILGMGDSTPRILQSSPEPSTAIPLDRRLQNDLRLAHCRRFSVVNASHHTNCTNSCILT